jgi:hypothetical protein
MSGPEAILEATPEQRSKVEITRNAKGDSQWRIVVVTGEDESLIFEAKRLAVKVNTELEAELIRGRA